MALTLSLGTAPSPAPSFPSAPTPPTPLSSRGGSNWLDQGDRYESPSRL